ncbi:hypothetical protein [Pseudophaeobacter arcticus]|uniref:hypothetical protein n=1 Tax=Pseudophaeobacter arcticus TaxID=385492 RepID=UPI003341E1C3
MSQDKRLSQHQTVRIAKERVCSRLSSEGIAHGLHANQIAAIALHDAAKEALIYGKGNFAYRGILTRNGQEVEAAYRAATDKLRELGIFDNDQAKESFQDLADEIQGMG